MFLKLADKVVMDTISNNFENCPDRNITLRIMSPLIAEKTTDFTLHQHKSFSFNQIFLKLSDKVHMNKLSDSRNLARPDHYS